MAKINAQRMDGGLYLCTRCGQRFGSIAELHDHEKMCKVEDRAPAARENGTNMPASASSR